MQRSTSAGSKSAKHARMLGVLLMLPLLGGWSQRQMPQMPPLPASEPDPAAAAWVVSTLAQLDLRQKVAQLVLPWIRGGDIPESSPEFARIRSWIEEDQVGGLIVSTGPAVEFAPIMNRLQRLAGVPLLIVSDLETGPAMRLLGGTAVPPAMALGAGGDAERVRQAGLLTASEARAAGIHMTLGPVLDVNSNPRNPIINTRSFGEDPAAVGDLASAWISGAREGGLLTLGKHFPGHGATETDSHIGLPTIPATRETLGSLDLVPFRTAIEAGVDAILVGHIAVPAIDGLSAPPASLSRGVITGLLREELGFDGLVFTDALNMGAITSIYSVPEASILALEAGADVLLQPPGERSVISAIVAAVETGRLTEARIDESVRRVLEAKARAGLHLGLSVESSGGEPERASGEVARALAAGSITLARDRHGLVPLSEAARNVLHITYSPASASFSAGTFNSELRLAGKTVEERSIGEATDSLALAELAEVARLSDLVIVSASLVPREYQGPLELRGGISPFIGGLTALGVPVVVVSFGSPYLLDYFPTAPAYLLAWSATSGMQRAAAEALLGLEPITGTLPVSLPPHHSAGEGIQRSGSR